MSKVGVFLRTAYNYDVDGASADSGLTCPEEEGKTQQSFKDECDINEIVRRFGLTGEIPENWRMPVSGDFTGVTDFHSAMNLVRAAGDAFMELPAAIRAEFRNDPGELLAFLEDDKNREKAVSLGLIPKPPEVTRDAVQAIDELRAVLTPPKV